MRVLFSATDPGGCDSILPLVHKLEKDTFQWIAGGKARDILKKEKIPFFDAESEDIFQIFDKFDPTVLLTGTSFGDTAEKKLIAYAKNKINSISVIDYWSNYRQRFDTLPDRICIIDEIMEQEMIKEGFPASILQITGNPRFDSYKPLESKGKDDILFISQPFSEMDIDYGFDELEVLSDLVSVFGRKIIIRPHPKDSIAKFKEFNLRISHDDLDDLIASSRIIIGMSSIVLFQAALEGAWVISYQPNVKKDLNILDKLKISRTIKTKEELKIALNKSPKLVDQAIIKKYTKANAATAVLKVIK